MSQIKIYGIKTHLSPVREKLSETLHACVMEAFQYPANKRAHRFFYLEKEDFYYPEGRTDQYTIIEISLFEGRSIESKKKLYQLIFNRFEAELGISNQDLEITLTETPLHNWGIRGKPGDELLLDYRVQI